MLDDTKPDEAAPFPVEVTVNGGKVTVTLMLTTVMREQKPEPPKSTTLVTPNSAAGAVITVSAADFCRSFGPVRAKAKGFK